MAKYDFLIVGAGIYGATCARLLSDKGYKCLIIDSTDHVGGLCYTQRKNNIDIHCYGPHVFHTNFKEVWDFVTKYGEFNNYRHSVMLSYGNNMYHMPFSMNTFYELFGTKYPDEARKIIVDEIKEYKIMQPSNLEEQCVSLIGNYAYKILVKGYSEKLWGRPCTELNMNIIEKMPIRFIWDTAYYQDIYQGIPIEGYTKLIDNIIGDKVDGMLGKVFDASDSKWLNIADTVIYTGPLDSFCHYIYGPLDWRCLDIETKDDTLLGNNITGNAVVNIGDPDNDLLQIVEHKWFTPERVNEKEFNKTTYISHIKANKWEQGKYPMYPVNNAKSEELYKKYLSFIRNNFPNVYVGGRSGFYRPMSMGDLVYAAMKQCELL